MTETAGGFARTGPYESKKLGATGRLAWNCQAKIVDPDAGIGLPPFKHGELWVRGPFIMKGNSNMMSCSCKKQKFSLRFGSGMKDLIIHF